MNGWIGLCVIAAVGCGESSKKTVKQGTAEVVGMGQDARANSETDTPADAAPEENTQAAPAGEFFAVAAHKPEEQQARFALARMRADRAELIAKTVSSRAVARSDWEGHFVAPASVDGAALAVATQKKGTGDPRFAVVIHAGGSTREVDLGAHEPAAIHLAGERLFVGSGGRVLWVDLKNPGDPKLLVERDDFRHKAYDLFARAGDRLVAIDDRVLPMYADYFELPASGAPVHLADWSLPSVINGQFTAAVLSQDGDGRLSLFGLAHYGIRSGYGQIITALAIRGKKLSHDADLNLVNYGENDPVLLEHAPRDGAAGTPALAGGESYSNWNGISRIPGTDRLAIAASERGVMVVEASVTPRTVASLVDVGGSCLDITAVGERVVALVAPADDKRELVVLSWEAGTLASGHRTALPFLASRLVGAP